MAMAAKPTYIYSEKWREDEGGKRWKAREEIRRKRGGAGINKVGRRMREVVESTGRNKVGRNIPTINNLTATNRTKGEDKAHISTLL